MPLFGVVFVVVDSFFLPLVPDVDEAGLGFDLPAASAVVLVFAFGLSLGLSLVAVLGLSFALFSSVRRCGVASRVPVRAGSFGLSFGFSVLVTFGFSGLMPSLAGLACGFSGLGVGAGVLVVAGVAFSGAACCAGCSGPPARVAHVP